MNLIRLARKLTWLSLKINFTLQKARLVFCPHFQHEVKCILQYFEYLIRNFIHFTIHKPKNFLPHRETHFRSFSLDNFSIHLWLGKTCADSLANYLPLGLHFIHGNPIILCRLEMSFSHSKPTKCEKFNWKIICLKRSYLYWNGISSCLSLASLFRMFLVDSVHAWSRGLPVHTIK